MKNPSFVFPRIILGLSLLLVGPLASSGAAAPETRDVRISLDWIVQGTHSPFFVALDEGYFAEEGLDSVTIDAGRGATNVAVSVAGGVYHFGWVDLPSMIRFNAQNPGAPLLAVYMSFDKTPLAVITRRDAGIRTPADLDGRRIAGGPGTAVHDTISILLEASGVAEVEVDWVAVEPRLFGPMLQRGEVDGTGGFTNSNIPAMLELGMTMDDLFVIRYSDFGADLYGLALTTTREFAETNPETVKSVVRALNRGTKDVIEDPERALEVMQAHDEMMNLEIERVRLELALELTNTEHTCRHGLSSVTAERLEQTIEATASAYDLEEAPSVDDVFTDEYLPPVEERMPGKCPS